MGKSSISEELAKYYKLHHIKMKDVIAEAIAKLVTQLLCWGSASSLSQVHLIFSLWARTLLVLFSFKTYCIFLSLVSDYLLSFFASRFC